MPLLQTDTAEGAELGMILARAPHELAPHQVAYLQDAIVNQPGFINRRGAITGTTALTAANFDSARPMAVSTITDPSGVQKIGFFYIKDTGTFNELWCSVYTPTFTFVQKHFVTELKGVSVTAPYPGKNWFIQATPGIDGSVIITLRATYGRSTLVSPGAVQRVIRWYGGCATSSLGNASPTAIIVATIDSTTITGGATEIAKISFPGMVINGVGVVASVTSTTAVELVYPSPRTFGASSKNYFLFENMPTARNRGRISTPSATTTAGVTGYGTRFTEYYDRPQASPGVGWEFFDATTMVRIGSLDFNTAPAMISDTVSQNFNPANLRSVSMKSYLLYTNNEQLYNRYGFIQPGGVGASTPRSAKGAFWTSYKGYHVSFNALVDTGPPGYPGDVACTSRAYIHGPRFPEIMDHSQDDGDWFEVQSTKQGDPDGIAVVAGSDCVVLCKALESFALTGNTTEDFTYKKIGDDGALSFESVASWKGRAIWMGRLGIWMYDGVNPPVNITEASLGTRWQNLVAAFDGTAYTTFDTDNYLKNMARCFVYKDYLFVNIQNTNNAHSIYTDGTARTSNTMQLLIYLPTMAVSYLTNFNFQCFFQIGNTGYVVLPQLGSTTHHIFPIDNLFTQGAATVDTILTANSYNSGSVPTSVGPWFHIESRRYSEADGLWRKSWKQLATVLKMTTAKQAFIDTLTGLDGAPLRAALPFIGTGSYLAARVKFRVRNGYVGFRVYEDINNRPATLSLGAWQLAYKYARKGSV